jgi:hypothetical protein
VHETYRTLAADMTRERLREAAEGRLAARSRRAGRQSGLLSRLRRLVSAFSAQPAPAPTLMSDTPARRS